MDESKFKKIKFVFLDSKALKNIIIDGIIFKNASLQNLQNA